MRAIILVFVFQTFESLHESTKVKLLCKSWSDLFVLGLAQAREVSALTFFKWIFQATVCPRSHVPLL